MKAVSPAQNFLKSQGRSAYASARGALISHMIGAGYFIAFLVSRAIPTEIGYTKVIDWPLRCLGLWLLLDRAGRYRSAKMTPWDWAHLFFITGFGCSLVYAELFMTRDTGLINYVQWISLTFNGYIFFLVVREGATRKGFNPEILLRWMLATLVICCVVALIQARDLLGLRNVIDNFYHQRQAEQLLEGPSEPWQARGPAVHANSLAVMLLAGLPILAALGRYKKLFWYDYCAGVLIVFTILATYSRTGLVSLAATGIALIALFFIRRETYKATLALVTVGALLAAFAFAVYAFDIQRYKVLVTAPTAMQNLQSKDTMGWFLRQQSLDRSLNLASQYPITGLMAASGALNQEQVVVKNAYTFQGLLLNVYAYAFVSYGFIGIAYLAALFWMIFDQARYVRTNRAFASALFLVGVAMVVAGIAENVLFFEPVMITINILMALALMGYKRVPEPARVQLED